MIPNIRTCDYLFSAFFITPFPRTVQQRVLPGPGSHGNRTPMEIRAGRPQEAVQRKVRDLVG